MSRLPALQNIPADLVCAEDYARHARNHLPADVYEYVVGGGGDELSLRRNREALDHLLILPRVLRDLTQGGTQLELCGLRLRHPFLLAPVAFQQLAHPEGELATARAAAALETPLVVSTLATRRIEDIAAAGGPQWFQLYFQHSREFNLRLIRRAEAAGHQAIMLTVDAPLHGIRNRAQRAGFVLPPGVEAVNLQDRPPLPRAEFTPAQSIVFQGMMSEAPRWQDVEWLRSQTRLPLILKGVLHPKDVLQARELGCDGVVLSNHGGRTLDCVPSAIEMLPLVRAAVGADYPLLVDGGIQRGTDAFKAIALGASAVMVGRPQFWALAVAGALGVAHLLRVLREELEVAMALAGTPTLADIGPSALWKPGQNA